MQEQQIVKQAAQTSGQSDALFLIRVEVEEQRRFVKRLMTGLIAFLLLWLAGLWYFKQASLLGWWRSMADRQGTDTSVEIAQVERLNQELTRLQEKLGKAVIDALHVKLTTLEDRIRMGQTGLRDLELIQSIKEDVGLLTEGGLPLAAVDPAPKTISDTTLIERISRLEAMFYLVLGVLTIILGAAVGYSVRCAGQLKRLEADLSRFSGQLLERR